MPARFRLPASQCKKILELIWEDLTAVLAANQAGRACGPAV
ncbi:MAG: hypothetical protein ABSA47_13585 [Verrucomicrobiota bacterium]